VEREALLIPRLPDAVSESRDRSWVALPSCSIDAADRRLINVVLLILRQLPAQLFALPDS
jgi:hypothetical protein